MVRKILLLVLAVIIQVCLVQGVTFHSTETEIRLQWTVNDITVTYLVRYGLSGDINDVQTISVTMPSQNGTDVIQPITGLQPGSLYEVELLRDGLSVEKQNVATRPLPVQDLVSHDITTTLMNVSWTTDISSKQDTFKVLVGGVTNPTFTFMSENVTLTWYMLTGLQHSQLYDISVLAYSYGEPSNTSLSFVTNTAPLTPTSLRVVAIDTEKLNISWTPDPNSIQDSYRIGYHYNSSEGNEVVVNVTCNPSNQLFCIVTMPGIPGQLYEVTVYALYRGVSSQGIAVLHTTVPNPITDLEETPQNGTYIGLQWKNPVNTHFSKLILLVQSKYGDINMQISSGDESVVLTSLQAGTRFNVTVYVVSDYENSTGVEKVIYTKPLPVQSLDFSVGTDSATAVWTLDESGLVDLVILDITPAPENSSYPITLSANTRNYMVTDLLAGNSYTVTITTKLNFKEGDPLIKVLTTLPLKPESVTIAVVSGSEVKVDWKAPVGVVDQYLLTLLEVVNGNTVTTNVIGTTYTYIRLKSGVQYSLKIESVSAGGKSEAVVKTFVTNPQAVSSLTLTTVNSTTLTADWPIPSNVFDYYELTINPADVVSPINISRLSAVQQYIFHPLQSGQLYTVSIRTFSQSQPSDSVSERALTSPKAVESLSVDAVGTGFNVSWKANMNSQQSGFIVSYKELPSGAVRQLPEVVAMDNHYDYNVSISDLYAGGTYEIRVQAWQNVSGENAASIRQTINGTTKPNAVTALTATQTGSDMIEVDWSPPDQSVSDHFFVRHRPSLRNSNATWLENSTYSTNLTLTHVFPGERYEIEVYTVNKGAKSEVMTVFIVVVPLVPSTITILENQTTENSITLQWLYNSDSTYVENWLVGFTESSGNRINRMVPVPASGTLVEATLGGLEAGFKYTFSVQSQVLDVVSGEITVEAFTVPTNNIILSFTQKPTNSSFVIDYTVPTADNFDQIVFRLVGLSMEVVRSKSNPLRMVEFSDLDSGALYNVEVQTLIGSLKSSKLTVTTQTLPNVPVVSASATSHDIVLTISRPAGGIDLYAVTCYSSRNLIVKNTTLTPVTGDTMVMVDQLQPYLEYRCEVSSVFRDYKSTYTITIATKEAAPSAVRNLLAIESAPLQVTLTWDMPTNENGVISFYIINFIGRKESVQVEGGRNVSFPQKSVIFDNFKAGYTYTFYVRAQTVEVSEPASVEIALKTYKPQYKDGIDDQKATPKPATVNPRQIAVNFTNAFSEKYGEVIQYTVIVTEDRNAPEIQQNHFLSGWKMARQDPAIKAYQVMSNCSTFFDEGSTCEGTFTIQKRSVGTVTYKVFTIGTETGCENQYYCNGPLKPDTTYYVTLRAYTTMQYQDTPFTEAIRTARIPEEDEGTNVGLIVGIIIPLIIIIVLVVLVLLFLRRRMAQKSNMYRHQPEAQVQYRSSLTKRKSCCPVNVSDFREHVAKMKADSDFRYAEQFEDLKEIGRGQPCSFAELPCNRGKNRFTNILPYDHSRVKLSPIDDEEGSDYINANYIPGFSSKREYIVCQGPLPATRDEFWRLIWEQNCRNIVMLTKCMEKGREKCDKYWPSGSDALFYGDLQVVALNETVFPDWNMTEFRMSLGDQSRQIRHFHFTSWPDFGVPKKEQVLVRFVRMVREKLIKDGGPITVHCSAGVGRSGTFVVLDRLLQEIKTHRTIDIFNIVAELRRERVWMVQTEQQYICIHNCILCILEGREDEHIYDNVGHSNVAFEDDEGVDLT